MALLCLSRSSCGRCDGSCCDCDCDNGVAVFMMTSVVNGVEQITWSVMEARQCSWGGSALFGSDVKTDLVINQWYIASARMALISFQFHHRPSEVISPVECRR